MKIDLVDLRITIEDTSEPSVLVEGRDAPVSRVIFFVHHFTRVHVHEEDTMKLSLDPCLKHAAVLFEHLCGNYPPYERPSGL